MSNSEHSGAPVAFVGGRIFQDGALRRGCAVRVAEGRIAGIGTPGDVPAGMARVDLAEDDILAPGFIDWQVNGGGGLMLNDAPTAATMATMAAAHRPFGTTSLLPTLITDRPEVMAALSEAIADPIPGVVGWHLEGPFLNAERKGIHRADFIRPITPADIAVLKRFAIGRSVVTLAPEKALPGAIAELVDAGLIVSIGHSAASAAEATQAADEGASAVTHLFNAQSQMTPREPGVVGTAFDDHRLAAGIIVDGLHVDPVNVRIAFRQMGVDRLTLVTDAMSTIGVPDGEDPDFDLMGRRIRLVADRLTGPDGTLAGAHLSMIEAVRRTVDLAGLPLEAALAMATSGPARLLGLADTLGTIRPGLRADLVLFGADWRVRATWLAGARLDH